MRTLYAIAVLVAAATQPAFAQKEIEWVIGELEGGTPEAKITVNTLKIDLNTPTSPAGAIIGADDIALTTVRTGSDLSTQLLSGFDENGVLQAGVGISGTPYLWLNPIMTVDDYYKDRWSIAGFLRRTQFALATKQLPDDGNNAIGVGASLSWQLNAENELASAADAMECLQLELASQIDVLSERDARASVIALRGMKAEDPARFSTIDPEQGVDNVSISREQASLLGVPANRLPAVGETMQLDMALELAKLSDAFEQREKAAFQSPEMAAAFAVKLDRARCDTMFVDHLKRHDSWVLTIAHGFVSDTGKYNDLKADKAAIYLQYKSGSENPISQFLRVPLIGLVSYVTDETVKIDDTTEDIADRTIIGFGSANEGEDDALDFQVSFARSDFQSSRPDAEEFKYSVAYSRRISEGIWLEFKAGSKSSDDVADDSFFGVSLKLSPTFVGN